MKIVSKICKCVVITLSIVSAIGLFCGVQQPNQIETGITYLLLAYMALVSGFFDFGHKVVVATEDKKKQTVLVTVDGKTDSIFTVVIALLKTVFRSKTFANIPTDDDKFEVLKRAYKDDSSEGENE